MMKAHAAFTPSIEFGYDIVGQKHDLAAAANSFVFFGIGLGTHQGQHSSTIRRPHRNPTFAGIKTVVLKHPESKLVAVESETSVLIPHENSHALNPEIRILPIKPDV
jgi:hypothetical protein